MPCQSIPTYLKKTAILYHRYKNQFGINNLRQHCSSLLPRDNNACFSQIFEERTFGKLNQDEMNLFMTQRTFESNCHTCQKTVTSNLKLFLIYVSNTSFKQDWL